MGDLERRGAAAVLLLVGAASVLFGGGLWAQSWYARWIWSQSPDAQRVDRQVNAERPVWLSDPELRPTVVVVRPTLEASPPAQPTEQPAPAAAPAPVVPTPARATADQIDVVDVSFAFLEPPEPGASARLVIVLRNRADGPSGPVAVAIPAAWFTSYTDFSMVPTARADRTDQDGSRVLEFDGPAAAAVQTIELGVAVKGETTEPPDVRLSLVGGGAIGEARPKTVAPRPRPGPAMALSVPRLNLDVGVLPVDWEPPPFVIGQIKNSANVGQGNTVLVGHLTGAAGNVFAHLDRLQPGDPITATSRGLDYSFMVSDRLERPNTDTAPLAPTDSPRLTLMTCTGTWNPFTHDYSGRLWVIAEPPDQAAVTIAERAAEAAVQATATAIANATATAAATPEPSPTPESTATVAPEPTATPFAAEVAPAGGLGNTRAAIDGAVGPPTGETSGRLVVYRKGSSEVRVKYTPDPPRSMLVVQIPPANAPLTFEAAVGQSRALLPKDSAPRTSGPEGNAAFVVERFTSPTLARALPAALFEERHGQPGDLLVVYQKDRSGHVARVLVGAGDDPDLLIEQAAK